MESRIKANQPYHFGNRGHKRLTEISKDLSEVPTPSNIPVQGSNENRLTIKITKEK